jgi:hypothetical protein
MSSGNTWREKRTAASTVHHCVHARIAVARAHLRHVVASRKISEATRACSARKAGSARPGRTHRARLPHPSCRYSPGEAPPNTRELAAHGRPWLRLLSMRACIRRGSRRTCRLATIGERGGRRPLDGPPLRPRPYSRKISEAASASRAPSPFVISATRKEYAANSHKRAYVPGICACASEPRGGGARGRA